MNCNEKKAIITHNWKVAPRVLFILWFIMSCKPDRDKNPPDSAPGVRRVIAEEVIQASSYTYVRVASGETDYWIAINKAEVVTGKIYYWSEGVAMKDFASKELNRTFPFIYLVQDFSDQPPSVNPSMPHGRVSGSSKVPRKEGISVKPAGNGVTLARLFEERNSWNGKAVTVRGEVVKFTSGVMNKNWIHIQDGTISGTDYDLAITSQDAVKIGDIVVFSGMISLNKDFGAGYYYDVIMEDGHLVRDAE